MLAATKLHGRLVGPVVAALVGSLLAVGAAPVVATDGEADEPANYSACVGSATEWAGFEDTAGNHAEAAIDCLAHYRITKGRASGRFDPEREVTRSQMALFLARGAGPAGIALAQPARQEFTDLVGLDAHTSVAIRRMAQLGIMTGTSATTFSPHEPVTRRQMADHLARFLQLATVGQGGLDIEGVQSGDARFEDIGNLPPDTAEAVMDLFAMGIVRGTSPTRFSPEQPVTRAQVALFITRTLAHTNARPAGITVQTGRTTLAAETIAPLAISVRDGDHRPVAAAAVDLFSASSWREAFENDGTCSVEVEAEVGDGPCRIDLVDKLTDANGNLAHDMIVSADTVLWAWTGDLYDRFDPDRTGVAEVEFTTIKPASAVLLTDDLHPGAVAVPYGRSVTFTFRLVDGNGLPVAEERTAIRIRTDQWRDGELVQRRIRSYYTDSAGEVKLTQRIRDPDPDVDGVDSYLDINVLDSSDLEVRDRSAVLILKEDDQGVDNRLPWSDDGAEPHALALELTAVYRQASDAGPGIPNTVRATLVDQYGDPVGGQRIHFRSNDPDGLHRDADDPVLAERHHRRTTDRLGVATVSYHRKSGASRIETIRAFSEGEEILAGAVRQYWVEQAPAGEPLHRYELLHYDEERNTLVIRRGGLGPYVVTFDANDRFDVDGDRERFGFFGRNLQEGDTVTVEVRSHDPDAVNSFTTYG